jgi:hypothetical protein
MRQPATKRPKNLNTINSTPVLASQLKLISMSSQFKTKFPRGQLNSHSSKTRRSQFISSKLTSLRVLLARGLTLMIGPLSYQKVWELKSAISLPKCKEIKSSTTQQPKTTDS